jgi:hypothetical protein
MIIEAYKYQVDQLYMKFKDSLHELIYNVENDEDVEVEEVGQFLL